MYGWRQFRNRQKRWPEWRINGGLGGVQAWEDGFKSPGPCTRSAVVSVHTEGGGDRRIVSTCWPLTWLQVQRETLPQGSKVESNRAGHPAASSGRCVHLPMYTHLCIHYTPIYTQTERIIWEQILRRSYFKQNLSFSFVSEGSLWWISHSTFVPWKARCLLSGHHSASNSGWCWAGEVTFILPSHCICLLLWSWLIQALSCSFGFYNVLSQLDVQIVTCLCSACRVLSLIIDHCPSVNWQIEAVTMNKWDRRAPKQALHHVSEWTLSFKVTLIQNSFGNGLPLSFMTCVRNRFALYCNSGYINLNSF